MDNSNINIDDLFDFLNLDFEEDPSLIYSKIILEVDNDDELDQLIEKILKEEKNGKFKH